ncbi:hypothetical protein DBV15_11681 [Temnothorax longispinosus]|uniref:Maelstrom domain-containing protein n=1 Tax=Temnothorax longispinosus TaxID=300112 RepID=A0A4S2KCG5_9HYME|nr:hypothetical protein DBV15_11681 [Temnothorax longispinosus]
MKGSHRNSASSGRIQQKIFNRIKVLNRNAISEPTPGCSYHISSANENSPELISQNQNESTNTIPKSSTDSDDSDDDNLCNNFVESDIVNNIDSAGEFDNVGSPREVEDSQSENEIEEFELESEFADEIDNQNLENYDKFKTDLCYWYINDRVSHKTLANLLVILRKHTGLLFPKDPRTLLNTPRNIECIPVEMQYYHFGFDKALKKMLRDYVQQVGPTNILRVFINIDGLPIAKSSNASLWPILCSNSVTKLYEAMAKRAKVSSQIEGTDKKTCLGESISALEQKEKEALILVDDNTCEYFPAKYAVGVFSLENGIEEVHHAIVAAEIPLGFKRKALEQSQATHRIPVECPGGATDFAAMYWKLVTFLESRKLVDQNPYLYTTRDLTQANKVKKSLKMIWNHYSYTWQRKVTRKGRTENNSIFLLMLKSFLHSIHISMKKEFNFHKYADGGSECCSKAVLYHWAWTVCDEFCELFGVTMKPGKNCPGRSKPHLSDIINAMSNLKIEHAPQPSTSYSTAILSMTGISRRHKKYTTVSEQHRLTVSGRTYEEEQRRRTESKPVRVIDCSKLRDAVDESRNEACDKFAPRELPREEKKLNKKPLRPLNIEFNVCMYRWKRRVYYISTTKSQKSAFRQRILIEK